MPLVADMKYTVGAQSASFAAAKPAADPSSDGGSSSSSAISANDFLTLLVTEMQNQDPTATTDPNEYINQLVNVNSLQQLIQINQTLAAATSANAAPSEAAAFSKPEPEAGSGHSASALQPGAMSGPSGVAHLVPATGGNLGIPATGPRGLRIGYAFSGPTNDHLAASSVANMQARF